MKLSRLAVYYYLRFIRLRGEPHELALGMAFGVFSGMLPIIPLQMALAVALALAFKGSKITAVIGTWVSNPANWLPIYYLNYKFGAAILGLARDHRGFKALMQSIHSSEGTMEVLTSITNASGTMILAFMIGGLIMGVVCGVPSYFIFLKFFRYVREWRQRKRARKHWQKLDQEKVDKASDQKKG